MSIYYFSKTYFSSPKYFKQHIEIKLKFLSLLINTLGELAAGQEGKALLAPQYHLTIVQIRLIVRIRQVKETIRIQIILI